MTIRADADRCPGVLRPHQAVDGAVLRVRIPGGRIGAAKLRALSAASAECADGDVQLTSRANLQLRGVRTSADGSAVAGLVDALTGAGLLPHPTHERVRNIVCSPLTGLVGGLADLRPVVADLDAALCARPDLAALPGPFLFVLDDGRGDAGIARSDLAIEALDAGCGRIWVGGRPGPRVPLPDAVPTLIGLARRFVRMSVAGAPIWHVRELPAGGTELLPGGVGEAGPVPSGDPAPLGVLDQPGQRAVVSLLAPLGRLTPEQVRALAGAAARGSGTLIVTPWRGVLVSDLPVESARDALDEMTRAGLVVDNASPWRGVTACPGSPRCARGSGDTEALARRLVAASNRPLALPSTSPVHIVACARSCGRPSAGHTLAVIDRQRVEIRCGERTVGESVDLAPGVIAATRARVQR